MSKLTFFAISSLEHWYISFIFKSDQVQIVDLLRWVRKPHIVSTWMSPWPERTAMALRSMGANYINEVIWVFDPGLWGWPGLGEVMGLRRRRGQAALKTCFSTGMVPTWSSRSVTDWSHDFDGHCEKSTVANFFQYWLSALAHNISKRFMSSSCIGSIGESSSCLRRTGRSPLLYGRSPGRRTAMNIVHGWRRRGRSWSRRRRRLWLTSS